MKLRLPMAAAILSGLLASAAFAEDYQSTPLLSTGQTVLGEAIAYPATGPAQISASIVTIPPGSVTALHRHGAPQFAYILSGELTVDYGDKGTRSFKEGECFVETMATPHKGVNHGTVPVKILSVFSGAEGTRNNLPPQ